MIKLTGYNVSEKIHENPRAVIYRAQREKDNTRVVIKILNTEYPNLKEIEKLRREFEITNRI